MSHVRECQQCGETYVPANGACQTCAERDAMGLNPYQDMRIDCWHCQGSGTVEVPASKWSIDPYDLANCGTCRGDGKIEPEDCDTCNNTGWAQMADPEDEPLNYLEPCGCDWTEYRGPPRPPQADDPTPKRPQEPDIIF